MEILGLEKVSFVDYEGLVCATVFTGGCNFFCPFCHNSGLVKKESIRIEEDYILDYLKNRKKLLDAVTISGGEPTLQVDLIEFIKKVKNIGYKVKLDTNGTNPNVLRELITQKLIDYVAMDIKNNFDDYLSITGINISYVENVKKCLKILHESGIDYELRTTLVKGFHEESNIEKMAEDLKGEKLLYLQKFVDSGACNKSGLAEIPKDKALEYKNILNKTIQNVILRGY